MKPACARLTALLCLLTLPLLLPASSPGAFPRIDSLLHALPAAEGYQGVVCIAQGKKLLYSGQHGSTAPEPETAFRQRDQFVIGSVSKQITAALVLRARAQGLIVLHLPIRRYLPDLPMTWADTVTVHQLLIHTSGVLAPWQPLSFHPGTQFGYSQYGYHLLAQVLEAVTGRSFADLCRELFRECGMRHSLHPAHGPARHLLTGYTETAAEGLYADSSSLQNFPAAGSMISTAADLLRWNLALHGGQVLSPEDYARMVHVYSRRKHPLFGPLDYGYGLTVSEEKGLVQYGQTGFAPGFVSMCYYYPQTGHSLILLSNLARNPDDLKETFAWHLRIRELFLEAVQPQVPR